jgi:hypothetical protein
MCRWHVGVSGFFSALPFAERRRSDADGQRPLVSGHLPD